MIKQVLSITVGLIAAYLLTKKSEDKDRKFPDRCPECGMGWIARGVPWMHKDACSRRGKDGINANCGPTEFDCDECEERCKYGHSWMHKKTCSWWGPRPDGRIKCGECGARIPPRAPWYHEQTCSKFVLWPDA